LKKYPFTKQTDIKDCGASCLSMIIKYYGGYVDLEQLKEMTSTNKNGVSAYHLIKTAESLGFDAKGVEIEFDNIDNTIILPSIAYTILDDSYKHYVVVYKINKNQVTIADPANKIIKMSFEDFKKIYKNIMIVLYPIHKIPKYVKTNLISKLIYNLFKGNYKDLLKMIGYSLLATALSIFSSFYFKTVIDNIDKPKIFFIVIFIIFCLVGVIKSIIEFYRFKILILINQKIDVVLTLDIFKKIILLPYSYYRTKTTGEIVSRFNDLSKIKEMISKIVLTLFVDFLLAFVTLIFLFIINKILFLIAFIMMSLYVIVILIFRPILLSKIKDNSESQSIVNSYLVETISGFETVKGINLEQNIINNFNNKYYKFLTNYINLSNIYNIENFLKNFIYYVGTAIIIFVSSILLGSITIGEIVLFLSLLSYFIEPIKNIVGLDSLIKESQISLSRINNIIDYENVSGLIKINNINKIEIKKLNYLSNEVEILKDINLNIECNEKIMMIGQSGGGKSTLLKIIKNYYETNSVFINDVCIKDIDKDSLKKIAYISQNEILFTDTFYNNIVMNRQIKQEEFLKVVKICCIDEIVSSRKIGYNTLIEENGFNISGGEKQRIILARTLLGNPDVILIDEGLSQMDVSLERIIIKNIFANYKNKIVIVVSHRLDNINLFDKIIKIENKNIEVISKNKLLK